MRKLTQPVLPCELAEALPVSLPASEKVHRAIFPALKHLQGQRRYRIGASGARGPDPGLPHPSSQAPLPAWDTGMGWDGGRATPSLKSSFLALGAGGSW